MRYWVFHDEQVEDALAEYADAQIAKDVTRAQYREVLIEAVRGFLYSDVCARRDMLRGGDK